MDVKTNKTVAIVLLVLAVMAVAAALATGIYYAVKHNRFSGYVYESGTGKPLAGVAVTNGRDVVKTDENGYYRLDGWLKDRFVTVTIPSGYWTEDFYIGSPVISKLAVSGDKVFALDFSGRLTAFEIG